MLAVHRHQRLVLELVSGGIGPGQDGSVGDVHQAHAAARMHLTRRADAPGAAVGEGPRLLVAVAHDCVPFPESRVS